MKRRYVEMRNRHVGLGRLANSMLSSVGAERTRRALIVELGDGIVILAAPAAASVVKIEADGADKRGAERYYRIIRDYFKAAAEVWGDGWGHTGYMITKPVTLKAMIRVCADLATQDAEPEEGRIERWRARLAPWTDQARAFKNEGFYERFPAKGQVERVARIHRELAKVAGIQSRAAGKAA
jgi:hypothetical protein